MEARPIVVGYDGSNTSTLALTRAVEVAEGLRAPLHVVTVANDAIEHVDAVPPGTKTSAIQIADQLLDGVLEGIDAAVEVVTRSVLSMRPSGALRQYARDVDAQLIIVGNLRASGLRRLLGNVPDDMAADAPCDVLIVKTT